MTLRRQLLSYAVVNGGIVMVTGIIAFAPLWLTLGWAALLLAFVALMSRRGKQRFRDRQPQGLRSVSVGAEIDHTHGGEMPPFRR